MVSGGFQMLSGRFHLGVRCCQESVRLKLHGDIKVSDNIRKVPYVVKLR